MSGRTPEQAVDAVRVPLQRAVSCVSPVVLKGTATRALGQGVLSFPTSGAVRLRGDANFRLSVSHWYTIAAAANQTGRWVAATVGYAYALRDRDDREVIAYHWHPTGAGSIAFPHLHVEGRRRSLDRKVHLPTGQVALVAVLRCAVSELGVEPLRSDWQTILEGE